MYNSIRKYMYEKGGKREYRSDIDGLRAIACLAVVAFHAFPEYILGGFIGVDIFFVISGFLISGILYRNLYDPVTVGQIDIVDFYIRRIRRIFPALLAVLLFMLVLGWFILLPDEYSLLGKHIFGGATYSNNIILFLESGNYFNANSNAKPLLHLWSLGIEEQFYLIFPLLLLLLYRLRINMLVGLSIFTVLSFWANMNAINNDEQTVAFYLPWCRFWELSIGGILAYIVHYYQESLTRLKTVCNKVLQSKNSTIENNKQDNVINNWLSTIGLCAIVCGVLFILNDTSFPGWKALIPVLGAFLIIGAGKQAWINQHLLSNKVMVFIGLISYPLYLWHWSLLSVAYIWDGILPNIWLRFVLVILAFLLAIMTYYFIEPALRYGKHGGLKAVSLFLVLFSVGGVGYWVNDNVGFPNRIAEQPYFVTSKIHEKNAFTQIFKEQPHLEEVAIVHRIWTKLDRCYDIYPQWKEQDNGCFIEDKTPQVVVVGDSHAGNLNYGLQQQLDKKDIQFNLFSVSCQIPALHWVSASTEEEFSKLRVSGSLLRDSAFSNMIDDPNTQLFILAHHPICSYIDLREYGYDTISSESTEEKFLRAYKPTLDLLKQKGKKVLFVVSLVDHNPAPFLSRWKRLGMMNMNVDVNSTFPKEDNNNDKMTVNYKRVVLQLQKEYDNVEVLDLADTLCDQKQCYLYKNNRMLFADNAGHFTLEGSAYVAPFITAKIEEMLKDEE